MLLTECGPQRSVGILNWCTRLDERFAVLIILVYYDNLTEFIVQNILNLQSSKAA